MEEKPMGTYSGSSSKILAAKLHIEDIRKRKFSIGDKHPNPLTEDLHNAVTNLSSELYTKDVHFLMELIQNAEDNEYSPGVKPTLEFVLTSTDITGVGAPATLLVFNNEVGFSKKNIDSLCSICRSTKKGQRHQGYIGEKGIGFKSVFLVSAWPHIYSNGYKIRFSEVPNKDCGIGYIVPDWISTKPTTSDVESIYGYEKILPTTTIILPLKPDKVDAVRKKLAEIHPEVLLFLTKIKRLSICENSGSSCSTDSISAISISTETDLVTLKSQEADCRLLHLSVQKEADTNEATSQYYIWRQVFPVKPENMVDARKDIKEWAISLAFPLGKRLKRRTSSVGTYAFLPTAMVTNFPFIVQADFILSSSRETILFDNKWNMGLLEHVASSFVSALTTFMKSTVTAEYFSVAQVLGFLPLQESPYKELNGMRHSIETMLKNEFIVPYESFLDEEVVFCQPTNAVRILPEFREILLRIKDHSILSGGISAQGKFVLHNSVDFKEYDEAWDFLGVPSVDDCYEWYGKCIQACNLMSRTSIDEYVDLLSFFVDNWKHLPLRTVSNIPFVKHITWNEELKSCSILQIKREKLKINLVWDAQEHAWLSKWNLEMGCPDDMFFSPDAFVAALVGHGRANNLRSWLVQKVGLEVTNVSNYCSKLVSFVREKKHPKLAVSFYHLVYHSWLESHLQEDEVSTMLHSMPVVDECGNVVLCTSTLMPAPGSKWIKLFGSNKPFIEEAYNGRYVELGMVYAEAAEFAGECTPENELLDFLTKYGKTVDLPDILPQDAVLQVASTELTYEQALLLLDWIQSLRAKRYPLPVSFIRSIRNGKWVKTYSGFNSPTQCFLCDGTEVSTLLEMGKILKILSAIDEEYYLHRIRKFKDDLMFIGVRIGSENMYQVIINHLKPLASYAISRKYAILMLGFIKFCKDNNKLNEDLLKALKKGKWLKMNKGYETPSGSIFLVSDVTEALLQITDLHVVDKPYYGSQFGCYVDELKLLGVLVNLEDVYKLIPEHFRLPDDLSTLTRDSVLLLLGCIQHLGPEAISLIQKISCKPWMKTSSGFRCSSESLLSDHKWGPLLNVVPLPIIDEEFYGSRIRSYKAELETIGVVVEVDGASKMLAVELKLLLSKSSLTSSTVISLLNCMKHLSKTMPSHLFNLVSCLSGEKWLKTCHGYKSAPDSILSNSKWEMVLQFVDLPFIDNVYYGVGIYLFKDELKMLGVVVDFYEGAQFVARGLKLPRESALVTSDCAHALLHFSMTLRNSNKSSDKSLVEHFLNILRGSKWLKTHMGCRSPEESILFNPEWECYLEQHDGPFIEQGFYGTLSSLEKDELRAMGVKMETEEVCTLISKILTAHAQTCLIMRIYKFLDKFKWCPKPVDELSSQLWIPDQHDAGGGQWVPCRDCVLHYKDDLFGSRLHALDKYYEKELLPYLSTAFGVATFPAFDDYLKLWNDWERGNRQVSLAELNSFWGYISEDWNSFTELIVQMRIMLLPAITVSGQVQLIDRKEVFIPDDLQLKRSFTEASRKPLFVWFPLNGMLSLSPVKLYEIYRSLGVRKLSEAVQFDPNHTLSVDCNFVKIDSRNDLIGKALIKIILGFLATMPMEERHKKAKGLLELPIFGTEKPLAVSFGLQLPSLKRRLEVEIRKPVLWDKNSGRLLVQKSSWNYGEKNMEFITNFSRAVSEAVVPNTNLVDNLGKIIQMGFAFGFKEDAVDYFLATENIELSAEDREFINGAFPPVKSSSPVLVKREFESLESPSTPKSTPMSKRHQGQGW